MRKLINAIINVYLLPLRLSRRLAIYVKGRILTYDEHYVATIDVAKREFPLHRGVIIDVGAFDADSTVFFAKAFPNNKVIGFEPNPGPFSAGVRNSATYSNIEMVNVALSHQIGKTAFYETKDSVSSSLLNPHTGSEVSFKRQIEVETTTMDTFFKDMDEVLLIKLDVQGAELNILHHGTATLRKAKLVLTELLNSQLYDGNARYDEVDTFIRANGFSLHSIFSNYNNQGTKYFDALYIKLTPKD